ncbi:cytidine deaminase [Ekhidna sp.]|uniref:cytidine deaminase n=1 Tax=Ekhidna sp. TaxID=2608089 RepID=UPI003B51388F
MSDNELNLKAKEAASRAYAPYSNFRVGCALITTSGNIYTGCNVENASYGLTICAERNAIANAINEEGIIEIAKLVVYTPTPNPTPPCGACRQVIHEFGDPEIMSYCDGSQSKKHSSSELLPHAFKLKNS